MEQDTVSLQDIFQMLAINLCLVDESVITPLYFTPEEFSRHHQEIQRLSRYFETTAATDLKRRGRTFVQLEVGGLSPLGRGLAEGLLAERPQEAEVYRFHAPMLPWEHIFAAHVRRKHIFSPVPPSSAPVPDSLFLSGVAAQCRMTQRVHGHGYCVVPLPHYEATEQTQSELLARLLPFREAELDLLEYHGALYFRSVTILASDLPLPGASASTD